MNQLVKMPVGCPRCLTLYAEDMTNSARDRELGLIQRQHEDPKACLDLVRKRRSVLETEILARQKVFDMLGAKLQEIEYACQAQEASRFIVARDGEGGPSDG